MTFSMATGQSSGHPRILDSPSRAYVWLQAWWYETLLRWDVCDDLAMWLCCKELIPVHSVMCDLSEKLVHIERIFSDARDTSPVSFCLETAVSVLTEVLPSESERFPPTWNSLFGLARYRNETLLWSSTVPMTSYRTGQW